MRRYHANWDPSQGKATRTRMIRELLKEHKGRMKVEDLRKHLVGQGYHGLIDQIEVMGFTLGEDGYVYGG